MNYDAVTPELRNLSYNHIGDIDLVGDVIYGGIEADPGTDLSMIRYTVTQYEPPFCGNIYWRSQ